MCHHPWLGISFETYCLWHLTIIHQTTKTHPCLGYFFPSLVYFLARGSLKWELPGKGHFGLPTATSHTDVPDVPTFLHLWLPISPGDGDIVSESEKAEFYHELQRTRLPLHLLGSLVSGNPPHRCNTQYVPPQHPAQCLNARGTLGRQDQGTARALGTSSFPVFHQNLFGRWDFFQALDRTLSSF